MVAIGAASQGVRSLSRMRIRLYGAEARELEPEIGKHANLVLVDDQPEIIVSYGGDGTLLSAELQWPGLPKVPIKNSRRGVRCMAHPPCMVIERLAAGELVRAKYTKLECELRQVGQTDPICYLTAMNEFNVHMGHINSAVRFTLKLDGEPYEDGREIIGDGLVISTPFGSTAYFNHITRGVFHAGMGIAFKAPAEQTNHLVVADTVAARVAITRGPAILGFDNAPDYFNLQEGDTFTVRKHPQPATLLTLRSMSHPSDEF
jgi:ATP-NAD kinase C-terminal domain